MGRCWAGQVPLGRISRAGLYQVRLSWGKGAHARGRWDGEQEIQEGHFHELNSACSNHANYQGHWYKTLLSEFSRPQLKTGSSLKNENSEALSIPPHSSNTKNSENSPSSTLFQVQQITWPLSSLQPRKFLDYVLIPQKELKAHLACFLKPGLNFCVLWIIDSEALLDCSSTSLHQPPRPPPRALSIITSL